ncbi:glycosyltransferase [Microbispora rosea]
MRAADPRDIADGVIEVMTDPALRRALAERGERLVRETLSWSRAAEETLAVYARVLSTVLSTEGTRR